MLHKNRKQTVLINFMGLVALLLLNGGGSLCWAELKFGDYECHKIGSEVTERPWITDLAVGDFTEDGNLDIVYCEGQLNVIGFLIGNGDGTFTKAPEVTGLKGPVHVEMVDMDEDGDKDLLVACMGIVFPNNDKIGSVVILENLEDFKFKPHVLLDKTNRVTDVQAGDLDADGDLDLAIAQFGYYQGENQWMENLGDWTFRSHPLLDLAGPIHAPIADMDADGDLDVVSLVSQEWEEVYLFRNQEGRFNPEIIYGSLNEDFGSSGISISDLDLDGDPDVLYTNGDGFDYALPGHRPWHGIQWLENNGTGKFTTHRISDFAGAYSPISLDIDQDGDLDIIAVSGFNDWSDKNAISMMGFVNDGSMNFKAVPLAKEPTHLIVVEAADFDGDGIEELVTGGFHAYPPWDRMSRVALWKKKRTGK